MNEAFNESLERQARRDAFKAVIDRIDKLPFPDVHTIMLKHNSDELVLDPDDDNYPINSWVNELTQYWIMDQGVQTAFGVPSEFAPEDTEAKIQAIHDKSPVGSMRKAIEVKDPLTDQDVEIMVLRVYDISAEEYVTEHHVGVSDDEVETIYRLISAEDKMLHAVRIVRPRHDELFERAQRLFADRSTLVDVADLLRGEVKEEDISAVVKGIKHKYGDSLTQEISDLLDEVKARAWALRNSDGVDYPTSAMSVAELMDLNKQLSRLE